MVSLLLVLVCCILLKFYIKPQQRFAGGRMPLRCILLKFYIKPQHFKRSKKIDYCCILLKFYIKPQLVAAIVAALSVVSY